eukprot:scaffold4907_cov122-Isochrysis_galbana.AAC.7
MWLLLFAPPHDNPPSLAGETSPLGAESQPLWNNTLEDVQPNPKFRAVWQTLKTVQVAHLTNDEYERYTREENEKALEKYKCDTIEGTVIIKGVRYVTSEILDSFEEICDAIPKEWLLPPMSREHLDRPCEGAWWGQRKALELLQKTSKNKICMIEAVSHLSVSEPWLRAERGPQRSSGAGAWWRCSHMSS